MTPEQALPQLLEKHVKIQRWRRPFELLRLIATLTPSPPGPVYLGRSDLRAMLDRTEQQAKNDHKVLKRLAARDGILRRNPGRGSVPDAWSIHFENAMSGHWVHVPWRTSKAAFRRDLAAFSRPGVGNDGRGRGERAGQGDDHGAIDPDIGDRTDTESSVVECPMPDGNCPMPDRGTGGSSQQMPHDRSESDHASQSSLEGKPSNSLDQGEGEGEVAAQRSPEAERLMAACESTMTLRHRRLHHGGADVIAAVADQYPSRIDELVDVTKGFQTLFSPNEAARLLRAAMERPPPPGKDPGVELEIVERAMRNLRAFNPDDPKLVELEAQAVELGAALASRS